MIREQSPPFYNISLKRRGFVRAQGGRGKHIQICLCLAQSIFFELPRPVNEATKSRATTKRREEAPRIAARTEK